MKFMMCWNKVMCWCVWVVCVYCVLVMMCMLMVRRLIFCIVWYWMYLLVILCWLWRILVMCWKICYFLWCLWCWLIVDIGFLKGKFGFKLDAASHAAFFFVYFCCVVNLVIWMIICIVFFIFFRVINLCLLW